MKKNFLLPILLLFYPFFPVKAQTQAGDSLKNLLANVRQDTVRAVFLAQLGRTYLYSKPDTALLLARQGLTLSTSMNFTLGKITNLNLMASVFNVTGNYPKAMELYLDALKMAESSHDPINMARLLTGIGILYSYQGDQRMSIDYTLKSLALAEKYGMEERVAANLINLGDSYEKLNILDSARLFTNRAYDMSVKLQHAENIGFALNNLGNIYAKMGQDEVAIANYRLAIPYLHQQGNQETLCETYMGMTRLFQRAGLEDSCLHYARLSFITARNGGFTSQVINASVFLSGYWSSVHRPDSAFVYQIATLAAKDSLFSQEKAKALQNLSFEEMIRQQKMDEEKAKTEIHRKHNIQYAIISIFLVSFMIVLMLLTRSIIVNERWIRFLGVLGLLLVFEFINLLIHPFVSAITNHTPIGTLILMVLIASLLIPIHHRLEHWISHKLVAKNKRIRLAAAKKIISMLETDADLQPGNDPDNN